MEFVWLHHPETGGVQRFAEDAAKIWRLRGWVDCAEPAQADPTREHHVDVAPEPEPAAVAVDVAALPADEAPKTTRRPAGNSAEKEQA